jgi:hypothetical protein
MGFRHSVHRSTLADANESRDWRIWADLAAVMIRRARKLYLDEDLGLELKNTVYALDATTIDLCLSLFDWAPFRKAKAAVHCYRSCRSRYSRKPRFQAPCSSIATQSIVQATVTS